MLEVDFPFCMAHGNIQGPLAELFFRRSGGQPQAAPDQTDMMRQLPRIAVGKIGPAEDQIPSIGIVNIQINRPAGDAALEQRTPRLKGGGEIGRRNRVMGSSLKSPDPG